MVKIVLCKVKIGEFTYSNLILPLNGMGSWEV